MYVNQLELYYVLPFTSFVVSLPVLSLKGLDPMLVSVLSYTLILCKLHISLYCKTGESF